MIRVFFAALCIAVSVAATSPATGQSNLNNVEPPLKNFDENGVDLVSGKIKFGMPLISFGEDVALHFRLDASTVFLARSSPNLSRGAWNFLADAIGPIPWSAEFFDGSLQDMYATAVFPQGSGNFWYKPDFITTNPDGGQYYASTGGPFTSRFFNSPSIPAGIYYADGTFGDESIPIGPQKPGNIFSKVVFPNGETWTYNAQPTAFNNSKRIRSIVSNSGFAIQFEYLREAPPSNSDELLDWTTPVKVSGYSKTAVACDESLLQICPNVSASLNSVNISFDNVNGHMNFTLPSGRIYRVEFTKYSSGITSNLWAVAATGYVNAPETRIVYSAGTPLTPGAVAYAVTRGGKTWNYSVTTNEGGEGPTQSYLSRTDPDGKVQQSSGYVASGATEFFTDELGRSSSQYIDPTFGRVNTIFKAATNYYDIFLDDRGNVTQLNSGDFYGSGRPPIIKGTAVLPYKCENPKTCNKPVTVTDANGNVTDYTYDPAHGGLLTETQPAVGGVRLQKRFEYAQRFAWVKNSSGNYVPASTPIWLKTRERHCKTTSALGNGCAGGPTDEVITDFEYGPDSGPNNLLLRGVAVTATNSSGVLETQRKCYTYDVNGRRISSTEPQANLSTCS